MKKSWILIAVGILAVTAGVARADKKEVGDRLIRATAVLREISEIPEKGIPQDLLNKCACVAVVPSM